MRHDNLSHKFRNEKFSYTKVYVRISSDHTCDLKKKPTSIIENFISYINTKSSDYEQVNNELTSFETFSVKGLNFEQIINLVMLYDGIGFLRIYSFELVIKYETLGFKEKWMHPPTTRSL